MPFLVEMASRSATNAFKVRVVPEVMPLLSRDSWSRCWRRIALSCVSLVVVLLTLASAAAESSVLLVVKGAPDQDTAPFELRLRSEFAAEGLEVVTASGRSQQNLLDLEGLARRTGALAALSVYVDTQDVQGRLWVSDPNSNVDLVRTLRVARAEGDSVSVFALRAVEALRGARLELEQQRRRMAASGSGEPAAVASAGSTPVGGVSPSAGTPQKPVSVPPKTNPAHSKQAPSAARPPGVPGRASHAVHRARWTILVGASAGLELNGIGMIGAPALDVRYSNWKRLTLGASFAGPFLSRRSVDAGVVQVDQELLDFQARLKLVETRRAVLEGFLATGSSRFAVSGKDATVPGTAQSAVSLGWTFGAGVGSQLFLTDHWIMGLDLVWLRRLPAPYVRWDNNSHLTGQTDYSHLTGQTDSLFLGKVGVGVVF